MKIKSIKRLFAVICLIFMISSILPYNSVLASDNSTNNNESITLKGNIIKNQYKEDYIRYGNLDNVVYDNIEWNIKNISMSYDTINITLFDGIEYQTFSGKVYKSSDQAYGLNYVAELFNENYETSYFSISENAIGKHLFSKNINLNDSSFIWYLNDKNNNFIVFEGNENFINTYQDNLIYINETADVKNDTLWFIYETKPVTSGILEPYETFSSINDPKVVKKGKIYYNTFYLTSTPIKTTCQAFLECEIDTKIPSNGMRSNKSILCIYQRVTDNGVDITGRVGNVFKLSDITYKVGVSGNLKISQNQEAYSLSYSVSSSLLSEVIKYYTPKEIKTATEVLELFKSVMTSGTTLTDTSKLNALSGSIIANKLQSKYYVSKDTELYGDYIGTVYSLSTYDPSKTGSTTGTVSVEFTYFVNDGTTESAETLTYTKNITTNIK